MSGQRYVSRELTHFVGKDLDHDKDKQLELLVKIVKTGLLGRRASAKGAAQSLNYAYTRPFELDNGELLGVPTVCFCDIPVADFSLHVRKYSEFGIAFPKEFLVKQGASPVFYLAENSKYTYGGSTFHLGNEYVHMLDRLVESLEEAQKGNPDIFDLKRFLLLRVLSYLKAFDSSLPEDAPDNYYMEREWRVIGKVEFETGDIARIIIPRDFAGQFRERLPEYCGQISFPDAD